LTRQNRTSRGTLYDTSRALTCSQISAASFPDPSHSGRSTTWATEYIRPRASISPTTADSIISVGAQPEFVSGLNRALQIATTDMVRWLTKDYGLEPWAAHQMISFQGKYDVVTVAGTMALRIPKKYLPSKP